MLRPTLSFLAAPFFVELSIARERGGDWDGSNVNEDHITFLRETRRLPGAGHVKARVPPEGEI